MVIGFDKDPLNSQLLLSLPFREMVGTLAHDRAQPLVGAGAVQEDHHSCILNGPPAWASLGNGLSVLDFNAANPDFLDCPAADTQDLDFTSEDFTLAAWLNNDSFPGPGALHVFNRGQGNVGGWFFMVEQNGRVIFRTDQVGALQITSSAIGEITTGNWVLIGATRAADVARLYKNGVDITDTSGSHVNPVAINVELHIGIHLNEIWGPMDGRMWNPRIWGRRLSATEMARIYAMESKWFN